MAQSQLAGRSKFASWMRHALVRRRREPEPSAETMALVNNELSAWRGRHLDPALGAALASELNRKFKHLFLLRIENEAVRIVEKPSFFEADEISGYRHTTDRGLARAQSYRQHIEDALRGSGSRHVATLVISGRDLTDSDRRIPVLAFQKPLGSPLVLLPDIDLIRYNFYEAKEFYDSISYDSKEDSAIFVGSTTGLPNITMMDVETLRLPRLRSAVFFCGSDRVKFYLPKIVSVVSSEVVDSIKNLGVSGRNHTWKEMFSSKFLLSMDGNGACCSRVAVSLGSNSVLMKYRSPYQLYYFSALIPWFHYIPVDSDRHVIELTEWCINHPDVARRIAKAGRDAAQRLLSRTSARAYTRALIDGYVATFPSSHAWS